VRFFFYNHLFQEYESSSAKGEYATELFESSSTRHDADDAKGGVVLGRRPTYVMFDLWAVFFWGTRPHVVVREEEQHQIGVHSGCFKWEARTTTTTTTTTTTGETGPDAATVDE
jgi:hypothetical protein